MKIGILSDSHDNLIKLEKAIRFFNRNKVDFVLHAGDFVAPFSVLRMNKLVCGWRGVFGNNDGEKNGLSIASKGRIGKGPLGLKLEGRRIILLHDINTVNPGKEDAECIIFGHTHKAQIIRRGALLLINPGECGGWLTGQSSVALLDLSSLQARLYKI
jgi:putative phosphoesterase